MGCSNINIRSLFDAKVVAKRLCETINVAAYRMARTTLFTSKIGNISFNAKRYGQMPSIVCGLVCSVSYAKRLQLSADHIWLNLENGFSDDLCIITNVEWQIK